MFSPIDEEFHLLCFSIVCILNKFLENIDISLVVLNYTLDPLSYAFMRASFLVRNIKLLRWSHFTAKRYNFKVLGYLLGDLIVNKMHSFTFDVSLALCTFRPASVIIHAVHCWYEFVILSDHKHTSLRVLSFTEPVEYRNAQVDVMT